MSSGVIAPVTPHPRLPPRESPPPVSTHASATSTRSRATGTLLVRGLDVSIAGVPIMRGVSCTVERGQLLGVIGPNGGGKTTFLRALLGLTPARRGCVMLGDEALDPRRHRVAWVPQQAQVDWDYPITVEELVRQGQSSRQCWWRRSDPASRDDIDAALSAVAISDQRATPVHRLSGGQRQRAMMARALAAQAELILLDEPFAGVDLGSQALLWEVIHDLRSAGRLVLLVHHELAELESADRLLLVSRAGTAFGPPAAVLHGSLFAPAFGAPYRDLTRHAARKEADAVRRLHHAA